MDKEWFRTWFNSPFYHMLYFQHNEMEARQFIDKLIQHLHPEPHSAMLDMGCGRGRHAKYLADKGFDVTGLDLSPDSIEVAKELEKQNLHFFEHDMQLPYAVNLFHYCFNFFTSFGYFRTQRENENALRTMAQTLKPGGTLMIDYLNTPYEEAHFKEQNEEDRDGVHFNIIRKQDEDFFYKTIEIKEEGQQRPTLFTEQVRKYSQDDFIAMLKKQKLEVTNVFGDYELAPYAKEQSKRMVIIAHRPGKK